ncbi:transketolase C-terminal domain-containing protein [Chakrabartyella piscis]|uniref:transketolase C-terminal domain-containing protein n=1 Tax=Chakrabartyella piscis TaxID=2918914 RepID=UPI0029586B7A|nr:transketolase C-terminal domain-containing protein [Chakrabartyella piscis]
MAEMMKGNVAIGEAAIRAGVRFYAGYPITPSSEIMEYLSWRLGEVDDGVFVQLENEIASINMVVGAASCGVRAMTASSGNGISLMQEAMSVLADENLPVVIITMVRYGNGLATLYSSQTDYLRETRGGGHGDYRCFVLCPYTVQEAVDMVALAYELAEKYKMVSIIMAEGALGQMMEPVDLPAFLDVKRGEWGFDGTYTNAKLGYFDRNSMTEAEELRERYDLIKENEQRWDSTDVADADYVFMGFGLAGRSCLGAVEDLQAEGHKVGFIRPITAWPFPEKAFAEIGSNTKGVIVVETNAMGQMVEDVAMYMKKHGLQMPVYSLPYVYGVPVIQDIKDDFKKIVNNELKEVF